MKKNIISELVEIPIESIVSNPFQPRKEMEEENLYELASSIQKVGLLQPPLVRKKEGIDGIVYELVAGERRVRACQKLGFSKICVQVCNEEKLSSLWQAEAALIENIQRVDLNPIDTALAMKQLMTIESITQEELAERVGKKRSTVSNYLRLLQLPESIQLYVRLGNVSLAHAKVLLSVGDEKQQKYLLDNILKNSWSVRQCETHIRTVAQLREKNGGFPIEKTGDNSPFFQDVVEKIQSRLGAKIELVENKRGGFLTIHFNSVDHFNSIANFFDVFS